MHGCMCVCILFSSVSPRYKKDRCIVELLSVFLCILHLLLCMYPSVYPVVLSSLFLSLPSFHCPPTPKDVHGTILLLLLLFLFMRTKRAQTIDTECVREYQKGNNDGMAVK